MVRRMFHKPRYHELAETQSALLAMTLGLWFIAPWWDTFNVPAYHWLGQFGNETGVGLFLLGCGVAGFGATRWGDVFWRRVAVMVGFVAWLSIALLFFIFDTKNTGGPVYAILAASTACSYLHLGRARQC